MNIKVPVVAGVILLILVVAVASFFNKTTEYEYNGYRYSDPGSNVYDIVFLCPEGHRGKSAQEAAELAFNGIMDNRGKAREAARQGTQNSSGSVANIGRNLGELYEYIEEELMCKFQYEPKEG